jgi:hypothetical protein
MDSLEGGDFQKRLDDFAGGRSSYVHPQPNVCTV